MGKWPMVRLGEVMRHRKEFITIDDFTRYKRCRVQLHAKGIVLRDEVEGMEIKTKKQQVCKTGDFLVAEIDAKVGGYGIVPETLDEAVVSSHYFLYEIDERALDRRFLEYYIKTTFFSEQVASQGSTNYAAIRPNHVLGYNMPLPPLAEQYQIITRLDQMSQKSSKAHALHMQAEAKCFAVIDAYCNELFSKTQASNWPFVPLSELGEVRSGVTLGRRVSGTTINVPYLRVANVQRGHFSLDVIKELAILEGELEKWKLIPGDLLLTEGGDWDKLGRCALWRGEIAECIHQNHIFRVRLKQGMLPEFVAAYVNSPVGKAYFQEASKQTTNLASINMRQLKAFPVPRPPREEQHRIVAKLTALKTRTDAIMRRQTMRSSTLLALLPSILHQVFRPASAS